MRVCGASAAISSTPPSLRASAFPPWRVVDAVRCAIEVQTGLIERNARVPEDRRIEFRVGIHLGDVVEESDGDLMGDGVNIAARLKRSISPRKSARAPSQNDRRITENRS